MSGVPGIINAICSFTRPVIGAGNIYMDVVDLITEKDVSKIKAASAISKAAILIFDILATIGSQTGKFSNAALMTLRGTETVVRLVDAPIRFSKTVRELGPNLKTAQGILRLVEQGALAPLAGIARSYAEANSHFEKDYLDQLSANPDAKRPVYEYDSTLDQVVIKGYKPIDPVECNENNALWEKVAAVCNITETVTSMSGLEATYKLLITRTIKKVLRSRGEALNNNGANQQGRNIGNGNPQGGAIMDDPQNFQNGNDIIDQLPFHDESGDNSVRLDPNKIDLDELFKFSQHKAIPLEFEGDKIFKKYVCVLTQCSIRHVVRDSTAVDQAGNILEQYYEREEVKKYIRSEIAQHRVPKSLYSQKPIKIEDLVEDPIAQAEIDGRLAYYEQSVKNYVDQLAGQE